MWNVGNVGGKINVNGEPEEESSLEHSDWPKCMLGEQHYGGYNSGRDDRWGVLHIVLQYNRS